MSPVVSLSLMSLHWSHELPVVSESHESALVSLILMSPHLSDDTPVVSMTLMNPYLFHESQVVSLSLKWSHGSPLVCSCLSECHESPLDSISLSESNESSLVSWVPIGLSDSHEPRLFSRDSSSLYVSKSPYWSHEYPVVSLSLMSLHWSLWVSWVPIGLH